jgi:negative regulator of sigma E activity
MSDEQDKRLREALRGLRPPPPGADARERVRAAVTAVAADAAAERAAASPAAAERPRPERRRPFAVFARHRGLALGLAALATAVLIAGVLLVGLPGGGGPEPVSASEVLRQALRALSSGRALAAEVTLRVRVTDMWTTQVHHDVDHDRILLRADGSYRLSRRGPSQVGRSPTGGSYPPAEVVFEARRGVLSTYSPGQGLIERSGYPPGPPDRWAGLVTQCDFSATGRALQVAGAARLRTGVYEGRPAWVVTCSPVSGPSHPAITDEWPLYEITIDQATSFPVCFRTLQDGLVQAEVRYRSLRVDAPLPDRAFELKAPAGAPVTRIQDGFRRAAVAQIARLPGYTTLVPASVPRGYSLTQAAAAPHAVTVNRLVKGRKVVALQYARGFDSLTVTTRAVADPSFAAQYDPFEPGQSWAEVVAWPATIPAGAFRASPHTSSWRRGRPHRTSGPSRTASCSRSPAARRPRSSWRSPPPWNPRAAERGGWRRVRAQPAQLVTASGAAIEEVATNGAG